MSSIAVARRRAVRRAPEIPDRPKQRRRFSVSHGSMMNRFPGQNFCAGRSCPLTSCIVCPVPPATQYIIRVLRLEAHGLSDPGCSRANNEDYYLLAPDLDLYLVADGMGGAQAGEQASKLAAETVAEVVWNAGRTSGEVLISAFQEANRRVLEAASADPNLYGMGTTLTAGWRIGNELLLANVGDSRAYLYQQNELHVVTDDQTWVNEIGRRLGIGETALKMHPMRHVLTMAIGVGESLRVQSYAIPLRPGDQVLLCSDGLHGVVDPHTIELTLASEASLEDKCQRLIEAARAAGGPDNITAVLLKARNST